MNPKDIMTDAIHNFHPQYQQYTQYSSGKSTQRYTTATAIWRPLLWEEGKHASAVIVHTCVFVHNTRTHARAPITCSPANCYRGFASAICLINSSNICMSVVVLLVFVCPCCVAC